MTVNLPIILSFQNLEESLSVEKYLRKVFPDIKKGEIGYYNTLWHVIFYIEKDNKYYNLVKKLESGIA